MALVRTLLLRNHRKLQEEVDIWRLYHLLYYFEKCGGKEVQVSLPKEVPYRKQYCAVHTGVTEQVIGLLSVLQDSVSRLPSRSISQCDADKPESSNNHGHSVNNTLTLDSLPFQLSVLEPHNSKNPVPGVRLRGHAVPGTVLCFFPGTVYLPSHLSEMPDYPEVTLNNPHLMSRTDGCIVDAKNYTSEPEEVWRNPFAVGHLVRHPLQGEQPCVIPFSYNVDPAFPRELLPLLPNRYHKKPGFLYSTKSPMRALVFVALKHIRDEELFLNYRLHPDSNLPTWYSSIDVEEDRRRWRY